MSANDSVAIEALERWRGEGSEYFVFAWSAFLWLKHYKKFSCYLDGWFQCELKNERLLIYALRTPPGESHEG